MKQLAFSTKEESIVLIVLVKRFGNSLGLCMCPALFYLCFIGVPVLICMSKDEPKHQSTEHFRVKFVPKTHRIDKKENIEQSTIPYDHIAEPSDNANEDSDRIMIYECGYVPIIIYLK